MPNLACDFEACTGRGHIADATVNAGRAVKRDRAALECAQTLNLASFVHRSFLWSSNSGALVGRTHRILGLPIYRAVKLIIKNREKSQEFANHRSPGPAKMLIDLGFRARTSPCACRKGGLPPARRHA